VPNPETQEPLTKEFTAMSYQKMNLSNVENVGLLDRANRMIVALTLATVAVVFPAIPAAAAFSLVVISMYAGLTAATGWDPLFVIVKALSQRVPEQAAATVTSLRQPEAEIGGDFQKAA
jgi:hypothetical protein